MTWNAPGDAVPIVLDCVAKPGLKVSQVKSEKKNLIGGIRLSKQINRIVLSAPGEEEGERGVRGGLGQSARH